VRGLVILMLADGAALDAVLGRGGPLFRERVRGRTLVNMATVSPSYSRALEEDVRGAGGHYVEAPVSGSREPARAAQLVVMLAGEPATVAEVRPLLAPMCRDTAVCGAVPNALVMKLAVNLFLITMVTGLAEAVALRRAPGARPGPVRRGARRRSDGQRGVSRVKAAKLVAQDHAVQASITNVLENNRLIAVCGAGGRDLLATARRLPRPLRRDAGGRARRYRHGRRGPRDRAAHRSRPVISFVLLSLPIFGVVALGWAAVRLRVVAPDALDALGAFSFRFGLPALVLPLIANQPIREFFNPTFYLGYLGSGACVFALVLVLSRTLGKQNLSDASARATTATVSNLGFLGLPLMLAFFGNRAAGPLAMAILAEVMVLLSIGCVLMSAGQREGVSIGRLVLRGTLLNPVVAALLVGAALAAADLALPGPVARFLTFLGGAAGPTALFALGGCAGRPAPGPSEDRRRLRHRRREAAALPGRRVARARPAARRRTDLGAGRRAARLAVLGRQHLRARAALRRRPGARLGVDRADHDRQRRVHATGGLDHAPLSVGFGSGRTGRQPIR